MSEPQDQRIGPADEFLMDLLNDDSGLLDEEKKPEKLTPAGRLERSFVEIVEFVEREGREPSSSTRVIAERKLGARLDGIRVDEQKVEALKGLDRLGLLAPKPVDEDVSLAELLDDVSGLLDDDEGFYDLSSLPEPKRTAEAPDSIAKRKRAEDFSRFEHLFKQKHAELSEGTSKLINFPGAYAIREGQFFVLKGVMLFVAEVGETYYGEVGGRRRRRERLRVIFENGTESDLYRQSLSTRLHEENGLAVVAVTTSVDEVKEGPTVTGSIYALESLSTNSDVCRLPNLHKIGFTTTTVEERIAHAETSPTYLMAPVKIVSTYKVYDIPAARIEHLLHRVFASARLDIEQVNKQGEVVSPAEWFIVPREAIDQAVELIQTSEIVNYVYDRSIQAFVERRD